MFSLTFCKLKTIVMKRYGVIKCMEILSEELEEKINNRSHLNLNSFCGKSSIGRTDENNEGNGVHYKSSILMNICSFFFFFFQEKIIVKVEFYYKIFSFICLVISSSNFMPNN